MLTTPQWDYPFRIDVDGTVASVEQGSVVDVAACVANILVCDQGAKLGDPQFGVPSLLFRGVPLNTTQVLAAVQRLEPRATLGILAAADAAAGATTQDVTVTVQVAA